MTTATLRPNATSFNSGWTITGAASAHAAVDDDPVDDATYVSPASGTWFLVFDIGPLTLPAYALIRSVSVRVRRRGNSSATLDVAVGYQPVSGSFQSIILSSGEKPTSTITTKTYGSLVTAPGGAAWDNDTIIPGLQVTLGGNNTNIRVYEVYVDVDYDAAPTCVITAPIGEVTGTQAPDVTFGYFDADGSALERVHAKVFTAAQVTAAGFGPDTATAFWNSGTVLTSTASVQVGVPLPAGDYYVYVRAADAGSGGRFGPWASAQFTMGGELPATPSLSVATDSVGRRNTLTVTQLDNYLPYGQSTMTDGWNPGEASNTTLGTISTTAPTVTTLAETFTGADGALSAANTDIDWTVVRGAFAVASNRLTSSDSELILPSVIRTDSALPSTDHYAQVVVHTLSTTVDRSCHLVLRMASSGYAGVVVELNQKFNRFAVWEALTSTTGRAVSGFQSLPKTLALPATWKGVVSGDQVYVYIQMANDASMQFLGQWTTSVLTGTQIGLGLYNAGSTSVVDTFEAGDSAPVVAESSGAYLLEMTCAAARQSRAISGGRYGWGTPVTAGEIVTVTASAWQDANAARSCRADVEYYGASDPLTNLTFSEDWTGTTGAAWGANWTSNHAGAATSSIQANRGRLTTGAAAYTAPARQYASGMTAIADCEVYVLVVPSSATAEMRGIIGLRTDGTYSGADPGHPAAGYFCEVDPQNDNVYVREAGVGSPVLATIAKTIPIQGVCLRFRVRGTEISAKAWDSSTQEPAKWDWIGADTTWTAAGKVTLTGQNGADAVARDWDFDSLTIDDLSKHSFGSLFTTATDGSLTASSRDVVVPAGAVYAVVILIAFPTGAGEVFVWDKIGILPGSGRSWSRGGLMVANLYGANAGSFELASAGVAGWTAGTDASIARDTYTAPPSGAALELSWTATSGFPSAIYTYGPAEPAAAGVDYAVRAWLWRIAASTSLLQLGIRFTDSSGGELAQSFAATVLPDANTIWQESAHTMRSPAGTASVQAVLAATAVASGSAAITRVALVVGTSAPAVWQPGPAALGYALPEYSDDGGGSWEQVRGTGTTYTSRVATVHDYEAPPGAARVYRASTAAVDYQVDADGAAVVVSVPSDTASATLAASGFWFRDPLVPARLLEIKHSGDLDHVSVEPQQVHYPLGRDNPVIVSDGPKGEQFTFPLTFLSIETYRQFEEMRAGSGVLLFQSDFGEQWFVKLGDNRRTVLKRSVTRATVPVRMVEVGAIEVDRPDPNESNAGIVTGVVWEAV